MCDTIKPSDSVRLTEPWSGTIRNESASNGKVFPESSIWPDMIVDNHDDRFLY